MNPLDAIVSIASDLTAALSSEQRYRRLLSALRRVIPYDAAALLWLDGADLVPVVSEGLSEDAMGRRFALHEQPRLQILCRSAQPVLFPVDSELPDPYDGLLAHDHGFTRIHACLGCALRVGDELIGVLTADAAHPDAFDGIDTGFLSAVGALAAAEMWTTHLIEALEQSAERQGRIARDLMRDVQLRQGSELIGTSRLMQRLREDIELVARSDFTVLITGETGVGKELVARAVHNASERRAEPLLYVNCAALPETLADSELFGHVRGAFTGASADRAGKFEVANGGTLFLDEIGELPLSVQPKLLRAIQQGEIQRVGSDKAVKANVRLVAATNRDLEQEVKDGKFRADLFHRLNVYPLRVPALRERADDIALLAGYFCDVTRRRLGLGPVRLEPDAVAALKSYAWPGNVRELENVLSRVTLKTASRVPRGEPVLLARAHLGPDFAGAAAPANESIAQRIEAVPANVDLKDVTRDFQRALIGRALAEHDGNWSAAARSLGMHRSNFHHLAVRLGLK
ncbi:MAG: nitric oxide reductase transcription regulator [Deltaproteobacteria bacterium CG2_30_63_29]|nr:MAG: nitric oxide reductase transcription regulator [Deltaproteobacteria bacterium CG2_30_63_29]PJB46715.1 MAG: nitric oxide reductase transcriptional regulator NorR [Deltaproteobacteria bacterium CG_4_9_14_3_um_filter_63_12]